MTPRLRPRQRAVHTGAFATCVRAKHTHPIRPLNPLKIFKLENHPHAQELANARHDAVRASAAAAAAQRAVADAAEDRHPLEFRYQRSIEALEEQVWVCGGSFCLASVFLFSFSPWNRTKR
jgi:glutathione S-transferase